MFQFQNGAVKRKAEGVLAGVADLSFNSKMVRLKEISGRIRKEWG